MRRNEKRKKKESGGDEERGRKSEGRWMGRRSRGRWFTTSCSVSRRTHDGKHSRNPECWLRRVRLPQIMCKCETGGLVGVEASLTVNQGRKLVTHSRRPLSFSQWKHKLSQGNCWFWKACGCTALRPVIRGKVLKVSVRHKHCELWDDAVGSGLRATWSHDPISILKAPLVFNPSDVKRWTVSCHSLLEVYTLMWRSYREPVSWSLYSSEEYNSCCRWRWEATLKKEQQLLQREQLH